MTQTPDPQQPQQPVHTPQPMAPPPRYQPPQQKQGNGLAVAGMVLGIIGLVSICFWFIGLPCAILGLILSCLGKSKSKITGTGGGMATAGIITSAIALALVAIGIILMIAGFSWYTSDISPWAEEKWESVPAGGSDDPHDLNGQIRTDRMYNLAWAGGLTRGRGWGPSCSSYRAHLPGNPGTEIRGNPGTPYSFIDAH